MPFETIIYEKNGAIAHISLNRVHVLNAYNIKMRDELYEVLSAIKDDDEVKVVILSGQGEKAFCAGADLSEFLSAPSVIIARQIRFRRDIWKLFYTLPQPLIAALHGYVLGSGLEMALFCDIRICTPDTLFGMPEVSLGIIPGAGGTQTLPRIVGMGKAMELLLTGKWIDASEALEIGLVNRVVEKKELIPTCEEIAKTILQFDQTVVQRIKDLVKNSLDLTFSEGFYREAMWAQMINFKRGGNA